MPGYSVSMRIPPIVAAGLMLWLLMLAAIALSSGHAHAASILPQGKACFYDSSGYPLADGAVNFYIPSTVTPKTTWRDANETVANLNPVPLDSAGCAVIYGIGTYREVVTDVSGNTIWDQLTTSPRINGVSWGGESYGTANAQIITTIDFTGTDGQVVGFVAGLTNTSSTTLAIQGAAFSLGTYSQAPALVVKDGLGGPVPLSGGEMQKGNVVEAAYSVTDGHFHLLTLAQTGAPPQTQFQQFTASGTWTKPVAGLTSSSRAFLECWGAGGGGGNISSPASFGGGGGGAYSSTWVAANSLGTTETVTVAVASAVKGVGGNSSFGSWVTAYGGGAASAGATIFGGAGGGGQTSAGSNPPSSTTGGAGGGPWLAAGGVNTGAAGANSMSGGGGGGENDSTGQGFAGGASYYGGGGGGSGGQNSLTAGAGGGSVWGGGGGGGENTATGNVGLGGVSLWGGAGGKGGVAGLAPGGGGGFNAGGARGQCQITLFP